MKVCGVDLKGNEAIVSLVSLADGLFHLPDCRTRRLTLADTSAKGLTSFQLNFAQLVEDYKIYAVIIRQRQSKGKFAGSAIGFKLEAAIELIEGLQIPTVLDSTAINVLKLVKKVSLSQQIVVCPHKNDFENQTSHEIKEKMKKEKN